MRIQSCLAVTMLLALGACGESGGIGGGSTELKPGEWEMKMELVDVKGPNIPPQALEQMKQSAARTTSTCMTEEEAKGPKSDMFTKGQAGSCKQEDFTWSGGKIHGVLTCGGTDTAGQKVTMTMDGSYGAENIDMTMKTKSEGQGMSMDMEMKMTGRRVGECAAGKA